MNQADCNLLSDGQVDNAIAVFQLNSELFPMSANTWDSLAEANWKAGNLDKAVELYHQAIEPDTENTLSDNARMIIEKIEAERNRLRRTMSGSY